MTTETRITQLPDDLQELISQHLHQSHMKDVMAEMVAKHEEEERMTLEYMAFVGDPPPFAADEEQDEEEPQRVRDVAELRPALPDSIPGLPELGKRRRDEDLEEDVEGQHE